MITNFEQVKTYDGQVKIINNLPGKVLRIMLVPAAYLIFAKQDIFLLKVKLNEPHINTLVPVYSQK